MKNIYCTLDTETFGGATNPKGIYHLGGIIHDRQGKILATFNYLIEEHYEEIEKDSYAKNNFHKYLDMITNGAITGIATEEEAVKAVDNLCNFYNVRYMMAFNSGFDFNKTACRQLIEKREFIDIWLMAVQTLTKIKRYAKFCRQYNLKARSGKSVATTAESFYAYLTNNTEYKEEHTAFEDSKIEMAIFLACVKTHQKYTKNCHCFGCKDKKVFPTWEGEKLNNLTEEEIEVYNKILTRVDEINRGRSGSYRKSIIDDLLSEYPKVKKYVKYNNGERLWRNRYTIKKLEA